MNPIALLLFLIIFLGAGPRETLEHFLKAKIVSDYKTVYELLFEESREGKTLNEFLSTRDEGMLIFSSMMKRADFEIAEFVENGDKASAIVRITLPDLINMDKITNELMPLFMPSLDREKILDINFDSIISIHYPNNIYPTLTKTDTMYMITENDIWKIELLKK